ncbi:MAG: hypothetical protein WCF65_09085 [Parachlamydiaceae bacterium]
MITQYAGIETGLVFTSSQESAPVIPSAPIENSEKKKLQNQIGVICARSFFYALQTEPLQKFLEVDDSSIKLMAERVGQFVEAFFQNIESAGKSDRLEFVEDGRPPILFVLERPRENKPVHLFIATLAELLGKGTYKIVYRARKISLHPDNQDAIEKCIKQIDSTPALRNEILTHLGNDLYVYSKAKSSNDNGTILFGIKMHSLMMQISEIAASPHCPPLPEPLLPPLYPDKVPKEVEFFQARFNTTLGKASRYRSVPLTDLKDSLTVSFRTIDMINACIAVVRFLGLLHVHSFAHRDIKENNIGIFYSELSQRFGVIVFDFDLVRQPRIRFDTPRFHDRWDGSTIYGSVLPSSDVYSLAVMFASLVFKDFKKSKVPEECNIMDVTTQAIKETVQGVCLYLKVPVLEADFSICSSTDILEKIIQHIQSNKFSADQTALTQEHINFIKKVWLVKAAALELLEKAVLGGGKLFKFLQENKTTKVPLLSLKMKVSSYQRSSAIDRLNEEFGLSLADVLRRLEVTKKGICES